MVVSLDLPSSRTRAKQVTSNNLSKKMGEMWESPATKKVMRQMAKTPKSEVAAVKKGKQTTGKPIKLRDLWWRYYHRRMLVRCEMHNDVTILGDEVPAPGTINDPYMELVTCGNAYRHLDSGDHVDGAAVRKHLGIGLKQRPTDAHIASMLGPCCLRVAGFNEERMQQWAAAARGLKSFESLAGSEMLSFPYSKAEALNLSTILATIYDSGGTAGSPAQRSAKRRAFATGDSAPFGSGPPWFQGGASQVQGYDGWANALVEWYDPTVVPKDKKLNKGDLTLAAVVPAMRAAATWQEANLIVQRLRRVGDFAAAQGLCTLVFGVFEGDFSKVFGERFDRSSLQTWCGFGPGPAKSIGKMFGSKYTGNELRGIQWLCENGAPCPAPAGSPCLAPALTFHSRSHAQPRRSSSASGMYSPTSRRRTARGASSRASTWSTRSATSRDTSLSART